MSPLYPPVPGIDALVPPIALGIGVLAGFLVYRHSTHHQVQSPLLWGGFVGVTFFLAPIILMPFLIPIYYSLFIPPGPGLLVRPLHALATVLGGGTLAAMGAVLVYFGQLALTRRQSTGSP
ncbi:hypothetical protein BDK88_1300 [Natrinema hispanicum]|uniref:Uncharacterized protein n=1 Tax=Natrinema hispanicum TaxID=392421 RepID=A0A482YES8_9EURY|nr:hypothetical protein BDK88_1300 [Natrinema hispanicum]